MMPQTLTLRARLRGSYLGAICIALLFCGAVWQAIYVLGPIIAEGCIRLINHRLRTSPRMLGLLRECEISWRISAGELWMALLVGLVAVMVARWLYAPEKRGQ